MFSLQMLFKSRLFISRTAVWRYRSILRLLTEWLTRSADVWLTRHPEVLSSENTWKQLRNTEGAKHRLGGKIHLWLSLPQILEICACVMISAIFFTPIRTSTVQGLFCVAKGTCFSIQSDFDTEIPTHCAHKALLMPNAHPLIATLSLANQSGQASGLQRAVTIAHRFNNQNIKAEIHTDLTCFKQVERYGQPQRKWRRERVKIFSQ